MARLLAGRACRLLLEGGSVMTGQNGYIWLHRKLLENPVWTQLAPAVAKVAIYFLLRANYKPIQWYDGVKAVEIPAGSFITSLEKTAVACNISVQQVRDAFIHLERTEFATYRRTHRWTLVTVLNWSVYQASPDEENTPENTEENTPENRQGTLNKKVRSKEYSPLAPSRGAVNGFPTDPDDLPIATRLEPFPPEVNGKNHNSAAAQNVNGRVPELASQQKIWFAMWWAEYWHKRSKKAAWGAFRKHVKTEERFQVVLGAIRAQKPEMLEREPAKRPYASTWLNGERWEDELQPPASATRQSEPPRIVL
jgi:hypothetical protein